MDRQSARSQGQSKLRDLHVSIGNPAGASRLVRVRAAARRRFLEDRSKTDQSYRLGPRSGEQQLYSVARIAFSFGVREPRSRLYREKPCFSPATPGACFGRPKRKHGLRTPKFLLSVHTTENDSKTRPETAENCANSSSPGGYRANRHESAL